ncbi:MAG: hypothetical protein H0W50_07625, partial [Parachlamydiaceae bacterium]|nr:hypothetical protein [Parachlamydiaceae bacterium]
MNKFAAAGFSQKNESIKSPLIEGKSQDKSIEEKSFFYKILNVAKSALSFIANFFYKLASLLFKTPSNVCETLFGKKASIIIPVRDAEKIAIPLPANLNKNNGPNEIPPSDLGNAGSSPDDISVDPIAENNSENFKPSVEEKTSKHLNDVDHEEVIPCDTTSGGQVNHTTEQKEMIKILGSIEEIPQFFSLEKIVNPSDGNSVKKLSDVATGINEIAEPIVIKKTPINLEIIKPIIEAEDDVLKPAEIYLTNNVIVGSVVVIARKPLRELDLRGRCVHTKAVQKLLNNEITHGKELQELNAQFLNEAKISEEKALALHIEFIKKYTSVVSNDPLMLEAAPIFENSTGYTHSSLFQLKRAIELAKNEFPYLTSLAFNTEQKNAVARLIQIILCGKTAQTGSLPNSPCCFQLRELKGMQTAYINTRNQGLESSYLFSLIGYEDENEDFKKNFANAFHSFVTECTKNLSNSIKLQEHGPQINLGNGNFLKEMINNFKEHLAQNAIKSLKIITAYTNSPLGEMYLSIQELLANAIFTEKRNLPHDSPFHGTLDYLSKLANDDYTNLANDLKCPPSDLQFFIQCKIIEIVLSMNSLNYDQTTVALEESLQNYDDNSVFSASTIGAMFIPSPNLDSMKSKLQNVIKVGSDHFFAEGIEEYFAKNDIIVAEVTSKEFTRHLCLKQEDNTKETCAISSLSLSWQATSDMMDYFVGLIHPQANDIQPENRFVVLKDEMLESIKKLNEVAALSEGWSSWTLTAISGYFGFGTNEKDKDDLKDIRQLASILNSAFEACHQYTRMATLSNKTTDQFIKEILIFRDSLINTYATLSKLQTQFSIDKQVQKSQFVNEILNYINGELLLLPSQEMSNDGYVKRISEALIWQSTEAKQISWKIQRYEQQISQLTLAFESHLSDLLNNQMDMTESTCGLSESMMNFESALLQPSHAVKRGIVNFLYNDLKEVNDTTLTSPLDKDDYYTQQRLYYVRKGYTKFLTTFRKSFEREMLKQNPNPINMRILQRIAVLLYTEINLYDELSDTLNHFNEMGASTLGQTLLELSPQAGLKSPTIAQQAKGLIGIQSSSAHNLKLHTEVKWIYTIYERIKAVPCGAKVRLLDGWINSAKGQWNCNFDPNMQSNPIHFLSTLEIDLGNGEQRKIKMLGMGTPTREDYYSVVSLVPEFMAFIFGYKDMGKKHLYINNQNMLPIGEDYLSQALNGDETARCKAIMGAQSLQNMKGALFAITLSKNSKFYRQEGAFKTQNDAKTFTDELYEQVFVKAPHESGCYISPEIRELLLGAKIDLDEKAKSVIGHIHTEIFKDRVNLTQEERKLFIELFYNKLTKVILIGGAFDSCNISCKDQIDRA